MKFLPNNHNDDSLELNLTPLIDVVFLLLIFFMVSTTFVDSAGIQVDLPKTSKTPDKSNKQELLTVTIDKNGRIFHNGSSKSISEIKALFKSSTEKTEQLIIRADSSAAHGKVVEIMDAAQLEGITKIAIAAESAK